MLKCKERYIVFIRQFSKQHVQDDPFSYQQICSIESRERCIQSMQRLTHKTKKIPERSASVLIPIVNDDDHKGALSLLYTLRSGNLRTHFRQVSFPGGIKDPGDITYADCASRETEEEIGIDRDVIDVWGEGQLIFPRMGPAIMPVVGYIHNFKRSDLRLNSNEVEKVFTIPLKHLCSVKCKKHTQFRTGYSIPLYTCGEERVWGITAVITNLFLYSLMPKNVYTSKIGFVNSYRITQQPNQHNIENTVE